MRRRTSILGLFVLLAVILLVPLGARGATQPTAEECLGCHGDRDLKRSAARNGRSTSVFVDPAAFKASVHGGLDCVGCHKTATAPHAEKLPAVQCADCHDGVPEVLDKGAHRSKKAQASATRPTCVGCHGSHTIRPASSLGIGPCANCHTEEVQLYSESIHGQSRRHEGSEAATCRSCHGPAHALLPRDDPRAPTYHLNLPRTCAQCHADPELTKRYKIPVADVYKLYMDSIHGRALTKSGLLVAANCSDCHSAHGIKPHTDPASRVNRRNVPSTCGSCHAGVVAEYRTSVHGQLVASGNPLAPVCIDCHTAHAISRVETEAWKLDIVKECGTCHAESLRTYRDTFHGKVTALGFTRVARCSDCHGAHGILPARDPASAVSPANRVTTCQKCHPAANVNFAKYDPHADPENVARYPLLHYVALFMTWLLIGTFTFFGIHTVLWGVRSFVGRIRGGTHGSGQ